MQADRGAQRFRRFVLIIKAQVGYQEGLGGKFSKTVETRALASIMEASGWINDEKVTRLLRRNSRR